MLKSTKQREVRERNKKFIASYLSDKSCVDCGENNIVVLEFDHLRDKKYNISQMMTNSLKTIQEEIDKCEVRCANCHRKITYLRRVRQGTIDGIDYL